MEGDGWHELSRLVVASQDRLEASTDRLANQVHDGFRDVRQDIADIRSDASGFAARLQALERWRLAIVSTLGPIIVGVIVWTLTGAR